MSKRESLRMRTLAAALVALVAATGNVAWAADHLDAPFVSLDGSIDINDVYVFNAANPDNKVLIMTVNPGAGVLSGTDYKRGALYELVFDTDFDERPDMTITTTFGRVENDGRQRVRVRQMFNGSPPTTLITGFTGETLQNGGVTFTADIFDDPFFFDLDAFRGTDGRAFCDGNEVDFFAGLNVSALVLELPKSFIGESYRLFGRTDLKGLQGDRMGLPAINTVFIPSNPFEPSEANLKDAFNATQPRADRRIWGDEVRDNLDLFYDDDSLIDFIADILLPDLLPVEESIPPGFEFLNGRQLADDVIDLELALITNGAVLSDCVDANDVPFLNEFPYLAPAN